MITKEFKQKWLTALTDGSYKHGILSLRSVDAEDGSVLHCCLGVAAELLGEKIRMITGGYYGSVIEGHEHELHAGLLPGLLTEKLGIGVACQCDLACLNDTHEGLGFPQTVIDYITNLPTEPEQTV